ncbi:hypothetical protein H6771_02000 [Candidatus Peribacteria bacterium]|nr:hypothetical protein [Candidatus Peribacteria bacterium]
MHVFQNGKYVPEVHFNNPFLPDCMVRYYEEKQKLHHVFNYEHDGVIYHIPVEASLRFSIESKAFQKDIDKYGGDLDKMLEELARRIFDNARYSFSMPPTGGVLMQKIPESTREIIAETPYTRLEITY